MGEQGRDILYKRVKSGFGVDNESALRPRKQKLKPLSESYIKQRRKNGVEGKFGSPKRSNLTNTGQMLDSFEVTANKRGAQITIPTSRRKEGGPNNSQVSRFVEQNGRPFFALTPDENQILVKEIEDKIRALVRRYL